MSRVSWFLLLAALATAPLEATWAVGSPIRPFIVVEEVLGQADELIRAGEPAQAIPLLERCQKASPTDARVPFLLAQCEGILWRENRKDVARLKRARAHFSVAMELKTPFPECAFLSGQLEMEAENYAEAVGAFREALAGRFRVRVTQQQLAFALYYRGLSLAEVVETGIDRAVLAASVFKEASLRFHALAEDTRLLPSDRARLRDQSLLCLSNLALMYVRSRNFPIAQKMLEELVELQPGNRFHHYNLGLLHDRKREWKKAIEHYRKSLELGQESAHLPLARILSVEGRQEEAEKHFESFLELHPKSWEGIHEWGLHHFRYGDYEKAIRDHRKCLELDPKAFIAMKSLSEALMRMGDREEAETWAEKFRAADREANRGRLPGKGEGPRGRE